MALRIDPEIAEVIPPLQKEEFEQLEENIVTAGEVYAPLIVCDDVILDGHNRFRIIQKYPQLKYSVIEIKFETQWEKKAWVCKNQTGRRNLNGEQMKYLRGTHYGAEKCSHGGDRKSEKVKSSVQSEHLISCDKTCEKLAKEYNVSPSTIRRSAIFAQGIDLADEIEPGIREDVLSRKIRPTQEAVAAVVKAEPHKRAALVAMLRNNPDRRSVKPTKKEVEAVANAMTSVQGSDSLESVMAELENALKSMMIRWSFCLRNNPSIFATEQCKEEISKLTQKGFEFMKRIIEGEIPNDD